MMVDKFNRNITYARISVTDLCDLRCKYCMPDGVEKKLHSDILSIEQLIKVSDALANLGVYKQRITGGEPLVRRGLVNLLSHIGSNSKVRTLAITTNGQRLAEMASDLKKAGVDRLNISMDTLDDSKFFEITKYGSLNKTLRGIEEAKRVGFSDIKLNAVMLKAINDTEIKTMADFAKQENLILRFIELMPFESQCDFTKKHFISTNDVIKANNLQKVENKSNSKKEEIYAFDDGTEVRFISPVSNKFCAECNRIRITADGKLLNCLHECREFDIKPYLENELEKYIIECVQQKPKEHQLSDGILQSRIMENIGG